MRGGSVDPHDRHSILAAGDHEGVANALRENLASPGDHLLVARALVTASVLQLVAIRSQYGRALVLQEGAALGVHQDRLACGARRRDCLADDGIAQHALGVVRQHDDVGLRQSCAKLRKRGRRDGLRQRCFALNVRPQNLLTLADVASLECRGTVPVDDQQSLQRRSFRQPGAQLLAGFVDTHHADQDGVPSKIGDIPRDIGSAAGHIGGVLGSHHGHGRLGRHALHRAVDEAIEHHIAEHQHPSSGEGLQDPQQVAHSRAFTSPSRTSRALHNM